MDITAKSDVDHATVQLRDAIMNGSAPRASEQLGPLGALPLRPPIKQHARPVVKFDRTRFQQEAIIDWTKKRSRLSEEIRIIKRQLLTAAFPGESEDRPPPSVVMVTSARPQEGKSLTTLNLALSISREPNCHVLLVDADGSPRGTSRFLASENLEGLLDVIADPAMDLADVIAGTDIPNLSILLAGIGRGHGPELLASHRMRSLIEEMAARYDDRIILIDAPPCLVSSEPAALAAFVGQILFVVEADRTQRQEVEASLELLRPCPHISLILNKTCVAMSDAFGTYSYE